MMAELDGRTQVVDRIVRALWADRHDLTAWHMAAGIYEACQQQEPRPWSDVLTETLLTIGLRKPYQAIKDAGEVLPVEVQRVLPPLTDAEELAELEAQADARRMQEGRGQAELQGRVLRRFRDWAVTSAGVESVVSGYAIAKHEVRNPRHGEHGWEEHMREKHGGAHGSYAAFLAALTFARRLFATERAAG